MYAASESSFSSLSSSTAAAAADENALRRQQLVMTASSLAPFQCSESYTRLPSLLQYGVFRLLSDVLERTNSPHTSNRMLDDSLILLAFGINYLNEKSHGMNDLLLHLKAKKKQLKKSKKDIKRKALEIQKSWRCHHFHTCRLPPLQLSTKSYLLEQESPVTTLDPSQTQELNRQTEKYMKELQIRLAKRQEEKMQQKILEKQQEQELLEKKRRLVQQRRKRYQNVSRKWKYLTSCLLRKYRDVKQVARRHSDETRASMILAKQDPVVANEFAPIHMIQEEEKRTQVIQERLESNDFFLDENSSRRPSRHMASAPNRNFMRNFVARVVEKAMSRVICSRIMSSEGTKNEQIQESDSEVTFITNQPGEKSENALDMVNPVMREDNSFENTPRSTGINSPAESSTSGGRMLKIGVLLCDLHFGMKYFGLIRRFFEQAARELHTGIEWHVYNCIQSHFPSKAAMYSFDGILVGGGPNTGTREKQDKPHQIPPHRLSRVVTLSSLGKSRIKGWRRRLVGLLQYLHKKKKSIVGLGLGHVILAEALGANIAKKTWENGWTILDPRMLSSTMPGDSGRLENTSRRAHTYGIKYLHGEYVRSMEQAPKGMEVLMNYDNDSVACFHDKYTLSFDGFPECGSFIFEAISKAYDNDREEDMPINSSLKNATGATIHEEGSDDEDSEEEEDEDLSSKTSDLGDTMLTLEERRTALSVTDVSALVARRFLQHFIFTSSLTSNSMQDKSLLTGALNHRHKHIKIMGAVGSNNETDVIESISLLASQERVSSIFLNVRASTDGHLVVLGSQLAAVVSQQDNLMREHRRFSAQMPLAVKLNGVATENGGFTLQQLREYKLFHNLETETPKVSPEHELPTVPSDNDMKNMATGKKKAKRVRSYDTGVLMLSEALDVIQQTEHNKNESCQQQPNNTRAPITRMKAKSVVIRFAEEDWVTSFRLPQRARAELRSLWLRLISALQVARYETPDNSNIYVSHERQHHITILSRHLQIIRFFRHKQPVWTYLKDLRLCSTLPQSIRKFPLYARYADGVLVDQESLLSCSKKEMQLIFKVAHKCGLKILVASRKDLLRDGMHQRRTSTFVQRALKETKSFQQNDTESVEYKLSLTEKETIMQDFMILDFLGVEGAMTWYTDLGVEAIEQLSHKSTPLYTSAEDLFKRWSREDVQSFKKRILRRGGTLTYKRVSEKEIDDGDELRDLSEASELSADESDFESEVIKQVHQHGVHHVESSSDFVPLRPLHPKSGDHVIQSGIHNRNVSQSTMNPSRINAPSTILQHGILLGVSVKHDKEQHKHEEQKQTVPGTSSAAFSVHLKPHLPLNKKKNDKNGKIYSESPRKKQIHTTKSSNKSNELRLQIPSITDYRSIT